MKPLVIFGKTDLRKPKKRYVVFTKIIKAYEVSAHDDDDAINLYISWKDRGEKPNTARFLTTVELYRFNTITFKKFKKMTANQKDKLMDF